MLTTGRPACGIFAGRELIPATALVSASSSRSDRLAAALGLKLTCCRTRASSRSALSLERRVTRGFCHSSSLGCSLAEELPTDDLFDFRGNCIAIIAVGAEAEAEEVSIAT